jgi:hypothetical protein
MHKIDSKARRCVVEVQLFTNEILMEVPNRKERFTRFQSEG